MSQEQAPVPVGFRDARGLVFFRLRSIRFKDGVQRAGQVLARMREGPDPPPFGAEAWKAAGGKWSYDFGGRRLERGTGGLFWEWLG